MVGVADLYRKGWIADILAGPLWSIVALAFLLVFNAAASTGVHRMFEDTLGWSRSRNSRPGQRVGRITRPPGRGLHRLAAAVFTNRTATMVFEPVIADMQAEYMEALQHGGTTNAKWVRIRGYWIFWNHVLLQLPVSLTKMLVAIWKAVG